MGAHVAHEQPETHADEQRAKHERTLCAEERQEQALEQDVGAVANGLRFPVAEDGGHDLVRNEERESEEETVAVGAALPPIRARPRQRGGAHAGITHRAREWFRKGGGGAGRRALRPCGSAPGLPSLPRPFLPFRLGLFRTIRRLALLPGNHLPLLRLASRELVLLPLEHTLVLRAPLPIGGRRFLLPELTRLAPAHRVSSECPAVDSYRKRARTRKSATRYLATMCRDIMSHAICTQRSAGGRRIHTSLARRAHRARGAAQIGTGQRIDPPYRAARDPAHVQRGAAAGFHASRAHRRGFTARRALAAACRGTGHGRRRDR